MWKDLKLADFTTVGEALAENASVFVHTDNNVARQGANKAVVNLYAKLCEGIPEMNTYFDILSKYVMLPGMGKDTYDVERVVCAELLKQTAVVYDKIEELKKTTKDKKKLINLNSCTQVVLTLLSILWINANQWNADDNLAISEIADYILKDYCIYSHYVNQTDIDSSLLKSCAAFSGLREIINEYPLRFDYLFTDNLDGSVSLNIWKKTDEGFIPLPISISKANSYKNHVQTKAHKTLWTAIVYDALVKAGYKPEELTSGELIELCFGPDYECHKINSISQYTREDLFKLIKESKSSGYVVSAVLKNNKVAPEVMGVLFDGDDGYVRLKNPLADDGGKKDADVELGNFVNMCEGLEINKSESLLHQKNFDEWQKAQRNALNLYSGEDYEVDALTLKKYYKCGMDIYNAMFNASLNNDSASEAFEEFFLAIKGFLTFCVYTYGSYMSNVCNAVLLLDNAADAFLEYLEEHPEEKNKDLLDACATVKELYTYTKEVGSLHKEPVKHFALELEWKLAEAVAKKQGLNANADELEKLAQIIVEDPDYEKAIQEISVVAMHTATEEELLALAKEFFPALGA